MLKGMGDLANMGKLMKQAQEMQGKMAEMQEQLDRIEVEGSSGAGLVTAIATAKGKLRKLRVDPSLLDVDEKEMLEDLIVAAVIDAQEKADERAQAEMARLAEGMSLPPGMKLPF